MASFLFLIITGTMGLGYLAYQVKLTPDLLSSRLNRNMLYIGVMFSTALLLGILGSNYRNNFIFFLSSVSTEFTSYFCLCWVRISRKSPTNSSKEIGLIVRPRILFWLNVTCLFELFCFLLAGKEIMATVSIARGEEDIQNTWLWLGSMASLVFVCSTLLLFQVELRAAIKQTVSHKMKYRYYTMALFILFFLIYFSISTIAVIFLGTHLIGNEGYYYLISLAGVFGTLPVFLLMAFLIWFDKKGFLIYQKLNQSIIRSYVRKLQDFYSKTFLLFPNNYRFNAYDFIDDQSPEWVLKSVVNQLIDVRILIWRIEAWQRSERQKVPIDKLIDLGEVTVAYEAKIWYPFLTGKIEPSLVVTLSRKLAPSNAVPPITNLGTEQLARYFISLDEEISKLITLGRQTNGSQKLESLLDV